MITPPRGAARERKYTTQARDFTGLRYGNITPTDIDALIDFHDRAYVLIETKYTGGMMPFGQRRALERLTDIIRETGRKSIAIVAEHSNGYGDIDFAKAVVIEYRFRGEWITPRVPLKVKDAIDRFMEFEGEQ